MTAPEGPVDPANLGLAVAVCLARLTKTQVLDEMRSLEDSRSSGETSLC